MPTKRQGCRDACQKDNLTPATGLNQVRETVRGQEVKNALNIQFDERQNSGKSFKAVDTFAIQVPSILKHFQLLLTTKFHI